MLSLYYPRIGKRSELNLEWFNANQDIPIYLSSKKSVRLFSELKSRLMLLIRICIRVICMFCSKYKEFSMRIFSNLF